jgi:hypothetical protein
MENSIQSLAALSKTVSVTTSFSGKLPFETPFDRDLTKYWDACVEAIEHMVEDGWVYGVAWSEELHIVSLVPLFVLPHCHVIVHADEIPEICITRMEEIIQNWRGKRWSVRAQRFYKNKALRVTLPVDIKVKPITTQHEFANQLPYLTKNIKLLGAVKEAQQELGRNNYPEIYQNVTDLLVNHAAYLIHSLTAPYFFR